MHGTQAHQKAGTAAHQVSAARPSRQARAALTLAALTLAALAAGCAGSAEKLRWRFDPSRAQAKAAAPGHGQSEPSPVAAK